MKKKILITWDYDKEQYVWATNPHDLQVLSRNWGQNYQELFASERQINALKDGGWIAAVTSKGIRVKI